jgi:hypothetical protein
MNKPEDKIKVTLTLKREVVDEIYSAIEKYTNGTNDPDDDRWNEDELMLELFKVQTKLEKASMNNKSI